MTRAKQFEESVSLNPAFHCCDWSDESQSFVIDLPRTVRMTATGGHYAPLCNFVIIII